MDDIDNSNIKKPYYKQLDVTKGLVIIFIVIVHLFMNSDKYEPNASYSNSIIVQILYMMVIVFFIISGFLYKPTYDTVSQIKKRMIQLLVPTSICIIVLTFVYFVWLLILGYNPNFNEYIDPNLYCLLGTRAFFLPVGAPCSDYPSMLEINIGYYYLQMMAMAFVLFYPVAKKVYHDNKKIIASIIIMLFINLLLFLFIGYQYPFHLEVAPLLTAFMLLGMYISKNKLLDRIDWREPKFYLMLSTMVILLIVSTYFFPPGTTLNRSYLGAHGGFSVFPFFLIGSLSSLILIIFCTLISNIPLVSSFFIFAGKHTLGLLLLSAFVIKTISAPLFGPGIVVTFPAMPIYAQIIICIVSIAICLIICEKKDAIFGYVSKALHLDKKN